MPRGVHRSSHLIRWQLQPVRLTALKPFLHHTIDPSSSFGVLTHFWVNGNPAELIDTSTWRFHIDGESEASIIHQPPRLARVGFSDQTALWVLCLLSAFSPFIFSAACRAAFLAWLSAFLPPTVCFARFFVRSLTS